jgi:hypothetical protein
MSLASYAGHCGGLLEELMQSWPEGDRDALLHRLRQLGLDRWEAWREQHAQSVSAFVAAAPARRAELLQKVAEPLLLKMAAAQRLAEANALLGAAQALQDSIGCSYREMAAQAGDSYRALVSRSPAYDPDAMFLEDWTSLWRQACAALVKGV